MPDDDINDNPTPNPGDQFPTTDLDSKEIRIKKVKKNSKGVVTIHFQRPNGDEWDDFTMACKSPPHPDFLAAFAALVPNVIEICELPQDYTDGLVVSGVSFSYKDEDNMGAVITAQKTLKTHPAPFILNTPHKPVAPYAEGGDDSACLTSSCVMSLEHLQDEAMAYIGGKRGQPEPEEGEGGGGEDDAAQQELEKDREGE